MTWNSPVHMPDASTDGFVVILVPFAIAINTDLAVELRLPDLG
jgi:hypothetical protein